MVTKGTSFSPPCLAPRPWLLNEDRAIAHACSPLHAHGQQSIDEAWHPLEAMLPEAVTPLKRGFTAMLACLQPHSSHACAHTCPFSISQCPPSLPLVCLFMSLVPLSPLLLSQQEQGRRRPAPAPPYARVANFRRAFQHQQHPSSQVRKAAVIARSLAKRGREEPSQRGRDGAPKEQAASEPSAMSPVAVARKTNAHHTPRWCHLLRVRLRQTAL